MTLARRRRTLAFATTAACVVLACGAEPTVEVPSALGDVVALQALVADDTCPGAMEDVDRAVDEDKPVLAARLLRSGAIPAAARQVRRFRDATVSTPEGRRLRDDGVTAYDRRRVALVAYADALERGLMEDLTLVMALEGQRRAEGELAAYLRRLEAVRAPQGLEEAAPDGPAEEPEGPTR